MNPLILILLTILLLATPDQPAPELAPKVEEAIQDNLEARKTVFWKECRSIAVERASMYVDSLLLAQASWTSEDSLVPPPRPLRPELNEANLDEDTIPLRPILPIRKDSR
ncbi:MAG: hypothetical protein K9I85_12665 [Saprospiraceae bacterium]|nr:hypothetical protein [Saprospiraceae bacterium]